MSENKDKYSIENTDYTVGQDNVQKWGFDVHNPVFGVSAGLIIFFLAIIALTDPNTSKTILNSIKWGIFEKFDGLFMWSTNFFLIFSLVIIVSPFGKIRLGGTEAKPDYSMLSWLSMLFAAGIGIGLLFYGVAEPLSYYTGAGGTPLNVAPNTPEAAKLALGTTIYHWGFHGWSIYGLVALSLAFFAYNKGLPLSMRSVFYPILGDRTWGMAGHIIDILAVLATLFGLATSLGLGAQQAASGLYHVFGITNGLSLQLMIIAFVTLLATISVIRGIDGGVKLISNINMIVAVLVLFFVMLVTFSVSIGSFPVTMMSYIENIIPLSNPHGREDETWMHGWTVFYWGWWMSWSPFVGMFIARISRGRTIREFLIFVLTIPTLFIALWMSIFGSMGIHQVANKIGTLGSEGLTDITLATFQMFDALPIGSILSIVSIVLILIFFISSSDSGSLVIDSITAGGKIDAPVPQRIFWAFIEGSIAASLLWVGGTEAIQALQAGTISTALPFCFVLLIMCVSLWMGMRTEKNNPS